MFVFKRKYKRLLNIIDELEFERDQLALQLEMHIYLFDGTIDKLRKENEELKNKPCKCNLCCCKTEGLKK